MSERIRVKEGDAGSWLSVVSCWVLDWLGTSLSIKGDELLLLVALGPPRNPKPQGFICLPRFIADFKQTWQNQQPVVATWHVYWILNILYVICSCYLLFASVPVVRQRCRMYVIRWIIVFTCYSCSPFVLKLKKSCTGCTAIRIYIHTYIHAY